MAGHAPCYLAAARGEQPMNYRTGDCVYPADLPRRFLCRVTEAQSFAMGGEHFQILKLEPLEGPWRPGTMLVREDGAVRPAVASLARRDPVGRRAAGSVRPAAQLDGEAA